MPHYFCGAKPNPCSRNTSPVHPKTPSTSRRWRTQTRSILLSFCDHISKFTCMFLVISLIFPKLLPVYMYISVFLFCLYLVILVFDCIAMFEPFFWPVCILWCPSPCIPFCLCLQWVYILDVVHKVLCWCGISSVDPALTAEVVLRLALVFESSAHMDEGKPSVYIILYHSYITTLSQWNGLAPN